jgi:hypothetical protein
LQSDKKRENDMKTFVLFTVFFMIQAGCAEVGEELRDVPPPDVIDVDLQDPVPDGVDGIPDTPDVADMLPDEVMPDVREEEAGDAVPEETGDSEDAAPEDPEPEEPEIDPGPGTCMPSDFPVQAQCTPGYKCTLGDSVGCTPTAICDVPGPQGENQICAGSSESDNCQAGFICLGDGAESRCRMFCADDADCPGSYGNSGCLIGITTPTCSPPDELAGVKVCSHDCDYFYQTGCDTGQACRVLIPPSSSSAYSDCTAAGTGVQDSSCPNGSVDCAPGYDCFKVEDESGVEELLCLQICNYSGGYPTCDSGYTCSRGPDWPLPIGACL